MKDFAFLFFVGIVILWKFGGKIPEKNSIENNIHLGMKIIGILVVLISLIWCIYEKI